MTDATRLEWLQRGLLALPFLIGIAVLQGLTVEIETFHGTDARVYQLPTILQFSERLDFSDYPSAQTPLYHVLTALWGELVGFDTDGGILRRHITEMGPVLAAKTVVRAFIVDIDCHQLGAVLVNDVTACTPGEPAACLDVLGLSSRVKTVRLYK